MRFEFYETPLEVKARVTALRAEMAGNRMLLAGLGLARLLAKRDFNPNQPRMPAGTPEGGQWTSGGSQTNNRLSKIAANDSEKPPGVIAVPMYSTDPLDPKNLNTPPLPTELQDIQNTLTKLKRGDPSDLSQLAPKEYKNYPDKNTLAVLPPSAPGYTSFSVGSRSGSRRLIIDNGTGATYYTNNHYRSFYHVQ